MTLEQTLYCTFFFALVNSFSCCNTNVKKINMVSAFFCKLGLIIQAELPLALIIHNIRALVVLEKRIFTVKIGYASHIQRHFLELI